LAFFPGKPGKEECMARKKGTEFPKWLFHAELESLLVKNSSEESKARSNGYGSYAQIHSPDPIDLGSSETTQETEIDEESDAQGEDIVETEESEEMTHESDEAEEAEEEDPEDGF
jgi:hypothetical protein